MSYSEAGAGSSQMEPQPDTSGISLFSYEELKDATNNFDHNKELGKGGYGIVYLGHLRGQKVAVKRLFRYDKKLVEQFVNEVDILSRVRHRNLVRLLGSSDSCSPELLLVYEFVANGTVSDHLHCPQSTLTLDARLQIALETADALICLHSLEAIVVHRDVKTANILLDDDLHVKLADMGICRLFPVDATPVATKTQSTQGYEDPEYESTGRLSSKYDVYSFGVVLLELVTGMTAVDYNRGPDDIYLDARALKKIESFKLKDIVDSTLGYDSDFDSRRMINSVAELARECLRPTRTMRPTMVQVLKALTDIKDWKHKIDDWVVPGVQPYAFSHEETLQATESFHQSRHLGNKKYRGYFDGRMVLVKERRCGDITQITDISRFRHKNLASIYGATKPDNKGKMFFVYEYVLNHAVGFHLHGLSSNPLLQNEKRIFLDWRLRFRIAIETADAISYLHSVKPPVTFGKLTINNILLDENLHVKLTGLLEYRRLQSVAGYYHALLGTNEDYRLYDVYSFGVVLLELISGSPAWDQSGLMRRLFSPYLANRAPKMIQMNKLDQFIDGKLDYSNLETKRMVNSVANLACICVEPDGKKRPTMSAVLPLLKQIEDEAS